jgi:hypothetical protein
MTKRLFLGLGIVMLLGAGCAGAGKITAKDGEKTVAAGPEMCVRTDGDTSGTVKVFAANKTAGNWTGWFSEPAVAMGEAGTETCGNLAFSLTAGDQVQINGEWDNGQRFLVENRTPDASGSDNLREIWIDDQYYAVGKECGYESNGKKGFDIVCTIR